MARLLEGEQPRVRRRLDSVTTKTAGDKRRFRHASYLLVAERQAVKRFEVLGTQEVSAVRPPILDIKLGIRVPIIGPTH
jgi:hypothetical protein